MTIHFLVPRTTCHPCRGGLARLFKLQCPAASHQNKTCLFTEVMATVSVVGLVCALFSVYISPNLGEKVLSLTDVDFDDKVFGSSTHFVMFYGPW